MSIKVGGVSVIDDSRKASFLNLTQDLSTNNSATGAVNLDLNTADVFNITMTGNCTFTFTNPPASGVFKNIVLILKQDGTGSRTMTVTGAKYTDAQAPVLTTTANKTDVLTYFTIDGGTSYFGSFVLANIT